MTIIKQLIPIGIQKITRQQNVLANCGLPKSYVFKRDYRMALWATQIDLLPQKLLSQIKTIVDVGANLGEWSIGMARLTSAEKILAYEPLPLVFKELQSNSHKFPQIQCINSAVGNSNTPVEINFYDTHQLSSILDLSDVARQVHGMEQDKGRKVTVQQHTLDQDLADFDEISVLKLDVQGYEPQVIEGAQATLQKTKILMTEVTYTPYYGGDLQFAEFDQLLNASSPLRLWSLSEPHQAESGRAMWADAVYVHESLLAK